MTSIIFAVVICDADDPCSVNTAYDPESSCTMSPWITTRPLYFFENLVPTPKSWDDKCPLTMQNVLFCLLSLLQRSPVLLCLTFVSCHASIFSSFSHSLSTAAFASGIFIEHRNKLVHKIVVAQRVDSFPCNVVFMIFV